MLSFRIGLKDMILSNKHKIKITGVRPSYLFLCLPRAAARESPTKKLHTTTLQFL